LIGPNDFHYSNAFLGQKMHLKFGLKVVQELVTLFNKFVSSFTCNSTNTSRSFQIGLLGTLFLGIIFLWFVPLFEKNSPLLHYFDVFLIKFNVIFGEVDHERVVKV
jgi:hypothetical protein